MRIFHRVLSIIAVIASLITGVSLSVGVMSGFDILIDVSYKIEEILLSIGFIGLALALSTGISSAVMSLYYLLHKQS